MKSKKEITFSYGDGFSGTTYFMSIGDKHYTLLHGLGNQEEEKEAANKAREILKQQNLEYKETVVFDWDGTM